MRIINNIKSVMNVTLRNRIDFKNVKMQKHDYIYTYIHICMCVHVYTHTCTDIYIYMYTRTHIPAAPKSCLFSFQKPKTTTKSFAPGYLPSLVLVFQYLPIAT